MDILLLSAHSHAILHSISSSVLHSPSSPRCLYLVHPSILCSSSSTHSSLDPAEHLLSAAEQIYTILSANMTSIVSYSPFFSPSKNVTIIFHTWISNTYLFLISYPHTCAHTRTYLYSNRHTPTLAHTLVMCPYLAWFTRTEDLLDLHGRRKMYFLSLIITNIVFESIMLLIFCSSNHLS